MGSTSTGTQEAIMSETFAFDLSQESAGITFRRNDLLVFEHLEETPESSEPPSPTAPTDLFQIQPGNEVPANSVPMHLLNQDEQEKADLLSVFPKAKVEGTCITASHFIVVVKLVLFNLKVSENPFKEEFARLLRRLSRELRSAPSFESVALEDEFSDPTDYDGCLGEMLKDMEDYIRTADAASLADGHVYVRRETDTYAQSLLAAATELNSVTS